MTTPPTPHNSLNLFFFKYYKVVMSGNPQIIMMAPARRGKGAKIIVLFGMMFITYMIMSAVFLAYRRAQIQSGKGGNGGSPKENKKPRIAETSEEASITKVRESAD